MQPHEYCVIGHSRAQIGRYLGLVAGLIASGLYLLVLGAFSLAEKLGLSGYIPNVILWPFSTALIFVFVHKFFDSWIWRSSLVQKMLKIPDISGHWRCLGKTKDMDGNTTYEWEGDIHISQTWEKITVRLKTKQSSSYSNAAALVNENGHGYRLIYRYSNEPRAGEPINSHVGFCELNFAPDLKTAEGDYFNNKGRVTFGQMILTKSEA
jgi:hypothetical protein